MDRPPIDMKHRSPGYRQTGRAHRCPRCSGPLVRIQRNLIDRCVSLLLPRRRYRCARMGCGWEGTLRVGRE
jgi:uncharacterized protein with PIN domain